MAVTGQGFGIDIGGSGIKGAPVDLAKGTLLSERFRIPTPQPSTPDAVAAVVTQIVEHFGWDGPFGCTFPAVVQRGTIRTAANVDKSWIGTDLEKLLEAATGHPVRGVNDADAAGFAEVRHGAAKDREGIVVLTTLGTGIGTAVINDGHLLPNTELGHLEVGGHDAETRASDAARDRDGLSWEKWAKRLRKYYRHLEDLLWPDLFVVGGGVSKHAENFLPLLDIRTEIIPAALRNEAGIVGAALLAAEERQPTKAGRRTSTTANSKTGSGNSRSSRGSKTTKSVGTAVASKATRKKPTTTSKTESAKSAPARSAIGKARSARASTATKRSVNAGSNAAKRAARATARG
jgi:polyphosphate glucokinase